MVAIAAAMRALGELVAALVDLFGAAAHEALATADVAVDVGIEQLHEQLVAVRGG